MKYGARNNLVAKVKSVKRGDVMSLVKFEVQVPHDMASVLTTESVDDLTCRWRHGAPGHQGYPRADRPRIAGGPVRAARQNVRDGESSQMAATSGWADARNRPGSRIATCLPHQASELQRPVLHDDDREVVAVLDDQESPVRRHILALMSHQVECVGTVEELDRHRETNRRLTRHASGEQLVAESKEQLTAGLCALTVRRQRTDRAAMAGGAIDRTLSRRRFEVFHFSQLLVDHAMHSCHLAGGALLAFVVARKTLLDMAMGAVHAKGAAVAPVHDAKKQPCLNCRQPRDLNVLEDLFGRNVFAPFDPIVRLFQKTLVHRLILLRVRRSRD